MPNAYGRSPSRGLASAGMNEPKTEPPLAGTETETLVGSLERQRATFA